MASVRPPGSRVEKHQDAQAIGLPANLFAFRVAALALVTDVLYD